METAKVWGAAPKVSGLAGLKLLSGGGVMTRYEVEKQLWEARAEDPSHLPVYFALYKFYAGANRVNDASRVLRLALTEAARQGGFHPDWERLNTRSDMVDLRSSRAGRFYLFALKVLASTKLNQQPSSEARSLAAHWRRLSRRTESLKRYRSESLKSAFQHE